MKLEVRAWDREKKVMLLLKPNTSYSDFKNFDLMLFTGKIDSKGNKIFEGDILRYKNLHLKKYSEVIWSDENSRFYQRIKILFKSPKTKNKVIIKMSLSSIGQMEIIGNIYEGTE